MGMDIIKAQNINKSYSGVQVLFDVNISVRKGEIHALVGENGAGKSTLIKILANVIPKDSGEVILDEKPFNPEHLIDAFKSGISIVYQDSTLIPNLSVAENIFIGHINEFFKNLYLNSKKMVRKANSIFSDIIGFQLDTGELASNLDFGERTFVEIARALSYNPKVLLLDEVTTGLDMERFRLLVKLLKNFTEKGGTVIYISHRLEEIFEISNRITVLRDGKVVDVVETEDVDEDKVSSMMVGRDIAHIKAGINKNYRVKRDSENKIMELQDLHIGKACEGISFSVHRGEVVGLAGLGGCGAEEILKAVFGVVKPTGGKIIIKDQILERHQINSVKKMGVAYIPKERLLDGLILNFSIKENLVINNLEKFIVLNGLIIKKKREQEFANNNIESFSIKAPGCNTAISSLSGGNQQKVMLAKWISSGADILLMNNPTRGVDVGIKYEIYKLIDHLKKMGKAILLTSEELPEIIRLSDVVICINRGRISKVFHREDEELTEEKIIKYMF